MMARSGSIGVLLAWIVAGCADHPTGGTSDVPPPNATVNAPAPAGPPSPADIERYRKELGNLMPEKRVVPSRTGPAPVGFDGVTLEGFDHVMIARRRADGKVEQACVDTVQGGVQFLSGAGRGNETE
jgi:hypothetical protein